MSDAAAMSQASSQASSVAFLTNAAEKVSYISHYTALQGKYWYKSDHDLYLYTRSFVGKSINPTLGILIAYV